MIETRQRATSLIRMRDKNFCTYEHYAREHQLTSKSLLILMWIYYSETGITQKKICQRTCFTKQVVNATVKNFIKEGWVAVESSATDKRTKFLVMTALGQDMVTGVLEPLKEAEVAAMAALIPSEQEVFVTLMAKYNSQFVDQVERLLTKGGCDD